MDKPYKLFHLERKIPGTTKWRRVYGIQADTLREAINYACPNGHQLDGTCRVREIKPRKRKTKCRKK